jgi:succinoglycan biosynthesis transport protein ExoP
LALVAGLAAVFAADHLSQGFEEVDDLHAHIALPLLACLPLIAARGPRTVANHVHDQPFSRASEAVRGLVSQLSLLGADGHVPRTLLVASASASEGKSTLALWLAMTVRQSGQSVLIIDGDHRRGGLLGGAKTTDLGLTALLAGSMTAAELIQTDVATGIAFIPAGRAMSTPFGAAELARLREVLAGLKQSYGDDRCAGLWPRRRPDDLPLPLAAHLAQSGHGLARPAAGLRRARLGPGDVDGG